LIRYRYLLRQLIVRDLKARYAGSVFGFLWAFFHSVWQLVLFTVVFSAILKLPLAGEGTRSFPAFLFAGLVPWMAVSDGLQRATMAIVDGSHLVKKLRFPNEILVVVATLSAFVHAAIALVVFLGVRLVAGGVRWSALPVLSLTVVLQLLGTLGAGLALAAICVFARDVAQLLGMALSALFYLTPIVYPIALVPERFRGLAGLNPLATVVASYRAFLVGSEGPDAASLASLAVLAAIALLAGTALFRRHSGTFADEL